MARPVYWTEDKKIKAFDLILDQICKGYSLRSILATSETELPSFKTFLEWVSQDDILRKQYAQALEVRAELKFESIESDYMEEPQRDPESGRIDSAWVNLQRLKIDAKKWELSKMMPKKYGDKQETTLVFEKPIFNGIDLDVPTDNGTEKDSKS